MALDDSLKEGSEWLGIVANPMNISVEGLSISRCVRDIADGKVPLSVVSKIIGGTHYTDLDKLWAEYCTKYWSDITLAARRVFIILTKDKRLEQPRIDGKDPPDSSAGIWRVENNHFQTLQLRELLFMSEYFLEMKSERRAAFFDELSPTVISEILKNIQNPRLKPLFPEMQKLLPSLPPPILSKMVKDRLKQFFQTSTDEEKIEVHSTILTIIGPLLKEFRRSERPPSPAEQKPRPYQFSQIRDVRNLIPKSAPSGETPPEGAKPPSGEKPPAKDS